jgi:hypothetical protein
MRKAAGRSRPWTASNGQVVHLPVTVDLVNIVPPDRIVAWAFTATIDLRRGEPRLVKMVVEDRSGLNIARLQEEFRWGSPLEIVRYTVPELLARGVDPFAYEFPVAGFPGATEVGAARRWALTDDFLEEMARRYLELGRGYSRILAAEHSVSPRTAISWIEKARQRGILSAVGVGSFGGRIIPASERQHGG